MADDAVGLLDAPRHRPRPTWSGASMGGMIAQTVAIDHPERVLSLTSIMSTTGDPDVGQPDPEVARRCCSSRRPPSARPYIATAVERSRADRQPRALRRGPRRAPRPSARSTACFYPAGIGHQLLAIVASPQPHRRAAPARRPHARDPRRRRPAGRRLGRRAHRRGHPRRRAPDPRGHGPRPAQRTTGPRSSRPSPRWPPGRPPRPDRRTSVLAGRPRPSATTDHDRATTSER